MATRKRSIPDPAASALAAARALALAGQHERAIERLTEGLAQPPLDASQRVALLVARAQSLVAMAEVARAKADALEAQRIAAAAGSSLLRIRAQLGRAYVLLRTDRFAEAQALAADAVEAARRSRNRELLAWALLLQSQSQISVSSQDDETDLLADEAAALFESLGQTLGRAGPCAWSPPCAFAERSTTRTAPPGRRRSRWPAQRATVTAKAARSIRSSPAIPTSRCGCAASRLRCRRSSTREICRRRRLSTTTWRCYTGGWGSTTRRAG